MPETQQRRAIAQMVLTFTSFRTTDQGNIGYVTFESDGEPYEVYVPVDDDMSEPGGQLAFADFAELIATASAPTVTDRSGDDHDDAGHDRPAIDRDAGLNRTRSTSRERIDDGADRQREATAEDQPPGRDQ